MKIQSLSIVVPSKKCINDCAFCVAKMSPSPYANQIGENTRFRHLYEHEYINRLEFARDNGCNTMMITGDCEPQQNQQFLGWLGLINRNLARPFRWIEIQTTGVLIDDSYLRFLREQVGVSTISVSISSFGTDANATYNGTALKRKVYIKELCNEIKRYDFNLRLSVNMTDQFNRFSPKEFFSVCKQYNADQVTLRILYANQQHSDQAEWVHSHSIDAMKLSDLRHHVYSTGRELEILEFGRMKYSIDGMSIVLDDDCMSETPKEELKYVILRPDCKLYSKWDDKGSLIF